MCSQVLPCPLCCKPNFESIDALKISLVKVTNRPLICPICNEILFGLDKLTIHLFSHSLAMDIDEEVKPAVTRNNEVMNKSSENGPKQQQQQMREGESPSSGPVVDPSTQGHQMSIQSPQLFSAPSPENNNFQINLLSSSVKCDICDFIFENQKHLSMHMNLVHVVVPTAEETSPKFPCHLCNKSFKMKGSLRVHLRVVHMHGFQNLCKNATNKNKDDECPFMGSQCNEEEASASKCSSDDNSLLGRLERNNNRRDEDGEQRSTNCAAEGQQVGADGTNKEPLIESKTSPDPSKSPWICEICTKSFTTKYFLKKHKRLHTGEMPYACSICGKSFTFQQSYHKHLLYHSDEKKHVCGTCGRAFKELSTLHNHERIHSGEKPFKCETCGKCFRQRVSYLVHRRIHTGSMPYQCTACAKSFRYKVSQRTHKCPAQPPGQVVVRQSSGDFLQKLLQNSNLINGQQQEEEATKDSVATQDEADAEERRQINELIDKSIEDMTRGKVDHINDLFPTPVVEEILGIPPANLNSPTDQFQNLCLYSHDTLNEESLKDLLYNEM